VSDRGVVFGGRLVRWGDVDDVKVWSESFREAEVEGSPVVGVRHVRVCRWQNTAFNRHI
jgi:hypothetical protein